MLTYRLHMIVSRIQCPGPLSFVRSRYLGQAPRKFANELLDVTSARALLYEVGISDAKTTPFSCPKNFEVQTCIQHIQLRPSSRRMSAQGRSSYGDVFNDEVNDEEPKFPSSTFPGGAVSLNETFSLLHILTDKQPEPDMLAMTREKS